MFWLKRMKFAPPPLPIIELATPLNTDKLVKTLYREHGGQTFTHVLMCEFLFEALIWAFGLRFQNVQNGYVPKSYCIFDQNNDRSSQFEVLMHIFYVWPCQLQQQLSVKRLKKNTSRSWSSRKMGKQNYEWVNSVNSERLSLNPRSILRSSLPYTFRRFLILRAFLHPALLCIQFTFTFPALFWNLAHARNVWPWCLYRVYKKK